jgi:A/G-specific adenine glycosylase
MHISDERLEELRLRILSWYATNGRDLPWRHTHDSYAVLVSEIMLQQTQAARVVPKYTAFLERFPDLATLARAPLSAILAQWSGLGYNTRAVRLKRLAEILVAAVANGSTPGPPALPVALADLERLPGIGPYTARAILIFAHNADLAAVDANVRRVLIHELHLPPDLRARELQEVAERALPHGRARDWHNALMDYGALVLTAQRTGVRPVRRQGPFVGSRRWYRSQLLKLLLQQGPQTRDELGELLGRTPEQLAELIAGLVADGLLRSDDHLISLAE